MRRQFVDDDSPGPPKRNFLGTIAYQVAAWKLGRPQARPDWSVPTVDNQQVPAPPSLSASRGLRLCLSPLASPIRFAGSIAQISVTPPPHRTPHGE
jgi:hypothetical protein